MSILTNEKKPSLKNEIVKPSPSDHVLLRIFATAIVTTGDRAAGGNIIFVNDLLCSLTGWKKNELIGQKIDVILPKGLQKDHDSRVILKHRDGHEIRAWMALDSDVNEMPTTVTAVILPLND